MGHLCLISDRGDGDIRVSSRKHREILRIVGHDHAAAKSNRRRDDNGIDRLLAPSVCSGQQVARDAGNPRTRRHDVDEAAGKDRTASTGSSKPVPR